MKIYRSLAEAREGEFRHPVVTLGVFDGVHLGHRYVIRECMTLASERAGESVVVTFSHHPRAIIAGKAPKLITSIDHRLRLFEDLGVDHCLVLTFDDELRQIPAMDFAKRVFEDILGAEIVVLGHNCRFGQNREGGADFLITNADAFPFETRHAEEIRIGSEILSSSRIREAIQGGDLERASRMLGRPFALLGTVVAGDQRGRELGFPTANLDLHHELIPPLGVYGCRIELDGEVRYTLTNIGVRPTFHPEDTVAVVEVHILDFQGDLYGRDLEVVFLTRLRGEKKFSGLEELKAQIDSDREAFLGYLSDGALPDTYRQEGH